MNECVRAAAKLYPLFLSVPLIPPSFAPLSSPSIFLPAGSSSFPPALLPEPLKSLCFLHAHSSGEGSAHFRRAVPLRRT